jgi:hypothetical protein
MRRETRRRRGEERRGEETSAVMLEWKGRAGIQYTRLVVLYA